MISLQTAIPTPDDHTRLSSDVEAAEQVSQEVQSVVKGSARPIHS